MVHFLGKIINCQCIKLWEHLKLAQIDNRCEEMQTFSFIHLHVLRFLEDLYARVSFSFIHESRLVRSEQYQYYFDIPELKEFCIGGIST